MSVIHQERATQEQPPGHVNGLAATLVDKCHTRNCRCVGRLKTRSNWPNFEVGSAPLRELRVQAFLSWCCRLLSRLTPPLLLRLPMSLRLRTFILSWRSSARLGGFPPFLRHRRCQRVFRQVGLLPRKNRRLIACHAFMLSTEFAREIQVKVLFGVLAKLGPQERFCVEPWVAPLQVINREKEISRNRCS